ncbi:recombination protein NinB [Bradyrhizobium elkanii]|uniref:recombination protein NinB n=1 Tax=Bradyrhizobium elkanii TaxID=29448 RepID=UPI00222776DD|nr:recombination protein NinB [Bradyrhizobium elkanii]MCW2228116.1 hypothetical protein [Bradyrhizobium elkanii]
MTRLSVTIRGEDDRKSAISAIVSAPLNTRIDVSEAKRSLPQNDLMWQRLTDLSNQVDWYGHKLTPTDWKDVMTAALRKSRVVPNMEGDGFVQLGLHTSDMTKEEMTALLDLMDAFGAERGVKFRDQQDSAQPATPSEPDNASDGDDAPIPTVAGTTLHWSALSDDWRDAYISAMTTSTTKAMSIATRHETALQMVGGKPNELELDWMRKVARVVTKRDKGTMAPDDYQAEIARLRDAPLEMPAEAA